MTETTIAETGEVALQNAVRAGCSAADVHLRTTEKLQKPKDEPFTTGGGGHIGLAILIAMLAVVFVVLLVYVGR